MRISSSFQARHWSAAWALGFMNVALACAQVPSQSARPCPYPITGASNPLAPPNLGPAQFQAQVPAAPAAVGIAPQPRLQSPAPGSSPQNPILLTGGQVPADAAPDTTDLLRRLEETESDLEKLRASQTGPETIGERLQSLEQSFKAQQEKLPIIKLSGFFHYDTGFFSQDDNSRATLGDIQNGSGFRRARLQALGFLTEHTRYSIEMDFGSAGAGRPSFQDVWGEQTNIPFFSNIRIGQYRQPITMDSWTNIRHLEFLERSAPFQALDPFRRVGAMSWRLSEDERTMLAYGVYGTGVTFFNGASNVYNTMGVDDRFATQIGDQGGVSFAIRGTHLLYYDELAEGRYLMHVGGGYNFSEIGGNGFGTTPDARTYEARAIPEFFVGDSAAAGLTVGGTPFFVDTGRFFATSYNLYHLEFAGNYGPAHFQSEYMATAVNQLNGPIVFYDGAYIQAGYFLTGESAGYNKTAGVLDYNVKPFSEFFGLGAKRGICGWGAWELAARWSFLDLSARNINTANYVIGPPGSAASNATTPPTSNPGVLNQSTVALNWWWNTYTRVQFNWIHSMLDNNIRGSSSADIYAVRFQIEF
jgi:phosphate-selective porin OprO and OprP